MKGTVAGLPKAVGYKNSTETIVYASRTHDQKCLKSKKKVGTLTHDRQVGPMGPHGTHGTHGTPWDP